VSGAGTVAIIDTGVDPNHPALQGVLAPGYDFTRDQAGGAETADLSQSTASVVDGGCSPSAIPSLSQSTASVVDGCGSVEFGHGTMVAGIVHMVAPTASLMPLKSFGPGGQGYLSDIIRAVYWAAAANARVINMSFSVPLYSQEFDTALNYAQSRNIISVAAAGNNGNAVIMYPAGFSSVMGVASTTMNDQRSVFSSYGQAVWVAAPGENIISTFPFGTYASGSGTSFSCPFVAGTAALILQVRPGANESSAADAIAHADPVNASGLGHGRLDVFAAVNSARP
jgi:subtilisin family serine protease